MGNVDSIRGNFKQSNEYLDNLINIKNTDKNERSSNPYIMEAIATKAFNCYFLEHHYESEFIFLKYLKKNEEEKNQDVLLILAQGYLKRGAYEEAYMIFKKLNELRPKSILIWLGIAITNIHRNKLPLAEEALANASKLCPHNSTIWGYLLIINFEYF